MAFICTFTVDSVITSLRAMILFDAPSVSVRKITSSRRDRLLATSLPGICCSPAEARVRQSLGVFRALQREDSGEQTARRGYSRRSPPSFSKARAACAASIGGSRDRARTGLPGFGREKRKALQVRVPAKGVPPVAPRLPPVRFTCG